MSKSLKIIQTVSKVANIVSKVIFICCTVGAIACAVGAIISAVLLTVDIEIGGRALSEIIISKAQMSTGEIITYCIIGILACSGEAVLARVGEKYFEHELSEGTPFTHKGAKELFRLSIFMMAVPIAIGMATSVCSETFKLISGSPLDFEEFSADIGMGLAFLLGSVICEYGAELADTKRNSEDKGE